MRSAHLGIEGAGRITRLAIDNHYFRFSASFCKFPYRFFLDWFQKSAFSPCSTPCLRYSPFSPIFMNRYDLWSSSIVLVGGTEKNWRQPPLSDLWSLISPGASSPLGGGRPLSVQSNSRGAYSYVFKYFPFFTWINCLICSFSQHISPDKLVMMIHTWIWIARSPNHLHLSLRSTVVVPPEDSFDASSRLLHWLLGDEPEDIPLVEGTIVLCQSWVIVHPNFIEEQVRVKNASL